jgi:hypothetical protein
VRAEREVDRDAAVVVFEGGDDVTPQVAVRECAGEEDERRPSTGRPPRWRTSWSIGDAAGSAAPAARASASASTSACTARNNASLAGEVVVHRTLRHPGRGRDLVDRRLRIALLAERAASSTARRVASTCCARSMPDGCLVEV